MQLPRTLVLTAALIVAATPALATASPPASIATRGLQPAAPTAARAYAAREVRDRGVAEFAAGSAVIVGVSAGALLTLIVALLEL